MAKHLRHAATSACHGTRMNFWYLTKITKNINPAQQFPTEEINSSNRWRDAQSKQTSIPFMKKPFIILSESQENSKNDNYSHQVTLRLAFPQKPEIFRQKAQITSTPGISPRERDRYRVCFRIVFWAIFSRWIKPSSWHKGVRANARINPPISPKIEA